MFSGMVFSIWMNDAGAAAMFALMLGYTVSGYPALLAQGIEQPTSNRQVEGSNPSEGTK